MSTNFTVSWLNRYGSLGIVMYEPHESDLLGEAHADSPTLELFGHTAEVKHLSTRKV